MDIFWHYSFNQIILDNQFTLWSVFSRNIFYLYLYYIKIKTNEKSLDLFVYEVPMSENV